MIGRTLGRYRVLSPLGEGGMGSVWKAEDTLLRRNVALKVLSPALAQFPEARHRFRREARVIQSLDHPAIVRVFESGETDGFDWIAMQLIPGETLEARIGRRLMPIPEAGRIASAVATALDHAHANGVLHRDVKPRNIMLGENDQPLLLDFGLALVAGGTRITGRGEAPGTLPYMAPEALAGSSDDPRSDIYSLAVVLYEMATGSLPHPGQTCEALIYGKLNIEPRPITSLRPDAPPGLEGLVMRSLDREPARRPDAAEFLAELRAIEGHQRAQMLSRAPGPSLASGAAVVYLGIPAFTLPEDADAQLATFAQCLADSLRRRLGVAHRLHVVQAREALGPDHDARAWASRHGANLVLDCRVGRRGTLARMDCTLLDIHGGVSLGGDAVEGSVLDPLEFEDRLIARLRRLFPQLRDERAEQPTMPLAGAAESDRFAQALSYLQRHDHEPSVDAAISLLEHLTGGGSGHADRHVALARACLAKYQLTHQHRWKERAAAAVEQALSIEPARPEVRLALADLRATTGGGDEVGTLYREALEERPEHFEGWLGLAQHEAARSRFADAETACRRAIALRPRDWRGYSMLGTICYRQGRYELALAPWRRALQLSPDQPRTITNMAAALFHLDRFEECEAEFRRALALEPNAATYANLGTVLYSQHRFADAIAAFEHACRLRPADARFWGYLGSAARRVPGEDQRTREAYERAIGLMREALELDPGDAESWAIYGSWLAGQHRESEAREAMARSLAIAPGNVRCMMEATHTCVMLGEIECALDHLERAVRAGHGLREIERSVELEPLRAHPRYPPLLAEARQRSAARAQARGQTVS